MTDLDELADMDAAVEPGAPNLRRSPGFTENLELLVLQAQARRRTFIDLLLLRCLPGLDNSGEEAVKVLFGTVGFHQIN